MIVFRQKYPRWWFDWNRELLRFSNRIGVYLALMDDRYPSTDEQQSVTLEFAYPDAKEGLNRWLPIVKWLLAIPHLILLFFLSIAAFIAVVIAWFAILFTGRYPRGLFDFVLGVGRWGNRVIAYAFILVTDQYPPFRLSP
jgi:dolichyl-phosphate-mannose--protein O-mannosyl transferase